jgi:hypothetical protein
MRAVLLLLLVAALTVCVCATSASAARPYPQHMVNDLKKACKIAYGISTDASKPQIRRSCNAYAACLKVGLNRRQFIYMYRGLKAGQDDYPYKNVNEYCILKNRPA